jgi:hypothetical protein
VFGVKFHQVDREWFVRCRCNRSSSSSFGRSRRDGRIVTYIDRRGIGRMIEPLFVVLKMLWEMKGWRFASTIGRHWLVSFVVVVVVGHITATPIQILDSTKNHEVAIVILSFTMMMDEWWSIRTGRRCCIPPIRCMIQHSVAIVVQVGARRRRRRMTAREWLKRSHWSMSIHNRR